jgi:hypothetical protein
MAAGRFLHSLRLGVQRGRGFLTCLTGLPDGLVSDQKSEFG